MWVHLQPKYRDLYAAVIFAVTAFQQLSCVTAIAWTFSTYAASELDERNTGRIKLEGLYYPPKPVITVMIVFQCQHNTYIFQLTQRESTTKTCALPNLNEVEFNHMLMYNEPHAVKILG